MLERNLSLLENEAGQSAKSGGLQCLYCLRTQISRLQEKLANENEPVDDIKEVLCKQNSISSSECDRCQDRSKGEGKNSPFVGCETFPAMIMGNYLDFRFDFKSIVQLLAQPGTKGSQGQKYVSDKCRRRLIAAIGRLGQALICVVNVHKSLFGLDFLARDFDKKLDAYHKYVWERRQVLSDQSKPLRLCIGDREHRRYDTACRIFRRDVNDALEEDKVPEKTRVTILNRFASKPFEEDEPTLITDCDEIPVIVLE